MALRPVHVLLLLVPLLAFLFYRTSALEAEVHGLQRRLSALDRGAEPGAAGAPTVRGAGAAAGVSASSGAVADVAALSKELATVRAELEKVRSEQRALGSPDAILGVVEQEQARKHQVLVDFHAERWHEMAEENLQLLTQQAGLTEFQRGKLSESMAAEVEALAEIARRPDVFDDPDKLANDVIQLLDETDTRVLAVLNPRQRGAWERHREHERRVKYPWLPR